MQVCSYEGEVREEITLSRLNLCCRSPDFDKISSAPFELKTTDQETAMSGTFPVATTKCNITYVTATTKYDQLLIHVHNGHTSTRTVKQVYRLHSSYLRPLPNTTIMFVVIIEQN